MAFIYIRGRREPIEIANERARKIKTLRFGDMNGENKAETDLMIDLGDEWAGELGKITAVEITKERRPDRPQEDPDAERKRDEARMLALPIEKRVEQDMYGLVKMGWWMRSGMREKDPPEAVMAEIKKAALDWYKEHPKVAYPPSNIYEPILTKYWGAKKGTDSPSEALADKMTLSPEKKD